MPRRCARCAASLTRQARNNFEPTLVDWGSLMPHTCVKTCCKHWSAPTGATTRSARRHVWRAGGPATSRRWQSRDQHDTGNHTQRPPPPRMEMGCRTLAALTAGACHPHRRCQATRSVAIGNAPHPFNPLQERGRTPTIQDNTWRMARFLGSGASSPALQTTTSKDKERRRGGEGSPKTRRVEARRRWQN